MFETRDIVFEETTQRFPNALDIDLDLVPEEILSTEVNSVQGVSAVKALTIASGEGQRIWTIDQTNLSEALAAINLSSDIENEIRSSVLSGKRLYPQTSPPLI